ncbi:rho GTPase-activating protein 24-like [Thalassophryne amazonica]|uniref:rho GTPase-activating protein 24-like n=1 Tax=Thalassophryne amazonica TaxID=390379 RepID=UPI001470A221|nr:rho GTPase-activating protein 24-like [Thalassophryne amazonica]
MGLSCFKSWKHDSAGHKGNRDVLASPGSYFFLSNSAGQGDEWLKSLNRGVWIPFTGVFGQRLEETVLYEQCYGVRLVPLVVEQCATFIRECGLHEVGLFCQPGQARLVKELQEAFDAGERPSFDSRTDVHTVASLLKLYLRQLPEPLVPFSRYQDFMLCGQKLLSNRTLGLVALRNLLHELPVANFNLLNFICQFLNEVQSYSSNNKMSCQNLATVFAPNILRAKAEDPQSIMGDAALVQLLMLELIREPQTLFSRFPPPTSAHPEDSHASPSVSRRPHLYPAPCLRQRSLPLIADDSTRESGQSATDRSSPGCISSAAALSDLSVGQKRLPGHRYTSSHPENCFSPLPSSSYPLQHRLDQHNMDYQHHAGRRASPTISKTSVNTLTPEKLLSSTEISTVPLGWEEAWPGLVEAGASFWSSPSAKAAGECGAVSEAASGGSSEAQGDSTPSVYDNLDRESLLQEMDNITDVYFVASAAKSHFGTAEELKGAGQTADSSSSCSSCEVLPLDDSCCQGDVMSRVCSVLSAKGPIMGPSCQVPEDENGDDYGHKGDTDDGDDDVLHPNSPASCSVPSDSPLSTGSSEVFLSSGLPDLQGTEPPPQHRDTDLLLGELRQQMAQQKADYQTRIKRLEQCNDALERQVAVLRVSLEQQKRSQSVAEVKICNMERAKADADRRNSTLQKEMELFFKMYGEMRRGWRTREPQSL